MTQVQFIEETVLAYLRDRRGQEIGFWTLVNHISKTHSPSLGSRAVMETRHHVLPVMTQLHRDGRIVRTRPNGRHNAGYVRIHEAHV